MVAVRVNASYDDNADKYFWLREPMDGSDIDLFRRRVAAVYAPLPPTAFMMLDPAVAGEPSGPEAVRTAIPDLPSDIAGIPVHDALSALADVLSEAPAPPPERRREVENALREQAPESIEIAAAWVADALGLVFPAGTTLEVDVCVVAGGVPLGGLTGQRIDGRPVCFAAVRGQQGSTFAEVLVHEVTHAVDFSCTSATSLVAELRNEPGNLSQLWHAPYFVASAEAIRRFVASDHRDYGDTHGYYAKVPGEMRTLAERGIVDRIRSWQPDPAGGP